MVPNLQHYTDENHSLVFCCECERSFCQDIARMWLPLQLAAEMTYTCLPPLRIYLLLAQIDDNDNNIDAHFGDVHHLNNSYLQPLN
jgi:hypothetical protein